MLQSRDKTRTDVAKPAVGALSDAPHFVSGRENIQHLHDWRRVPDLAHVLLMGSPWIFIDSYIV